MAALLQHYYIYIHETTRLISRCVYLLLILIHVPSELEWLRKTPYSVQGSLCFRVDRLFSADQDNCLDPVNVTVYYTLNK